MKRVAKILIVDDDEGVRTSFGHVLREGGYEVFLAESGKDGLREHRASPMDLAIIDLFMPDQDGLEIISQLHKESPDVPIIAISGGYAASTTMLAVAQGMGAAKVLEKPFDSNVLLLAVEQLLQAA
jgi:DNA-binding NtrC family response regulator